MKHLTGQEICLNKIITSSLMCNIVKYTVICNDETIKKSFIHYELFCIEARIADSMLCDRNIKSNWRLQQARSA